MECTTNGMVLPHKCCEEKRESAMKRWAKLYIKGLSAMGFEYMSYIK